MIRKTEKYYTKRIRKYKGVNRTYDEYGTQYIKNTTYWLLLFVNGYELIQNWRNKNKMMEIMELINTTSGQIFGALFGFQAALILIDIMEIREVKYIPG